MQDLYEGWGRKVKNVLKERGHSQKWLADACDVDPSTITRIIKGEICANDVLKFKIAGALGKSMDELFPWPLTVPPAPEHMGERVA